MFFLVQAAFISPNVLHDMFRDKDSNSNFVFHRSLPFCFWGTRHATCIFMRVEGGVPRFKVVSNWPSIMRPEAFQQVRLMSHAARTDIREHGCPPAIRLGRRPWR